MGNILNKGASSFKQLSKNLALLFITISILLLAGEYIARFVFKDITTTWDNRSYFAIKWKKENIKLNSINFREREINLNKPDSSYRIVVIGDSFTFGQGIPEKDRVSNIVEAKLGKIKNGIEVLNCGVPGANTVEEIEILKNLLSKARPDFILLQWFINDVEVLHGGGSQPKRKPSFLNELKAGTRKLSVIYFLLSEQLNMVREKSGLYESYPDSMLRRFGNPDSAESREAENNLLEFVRLCKEAKVPLGVVLVPQLVPLAGAAYPYGFLHERVSKWCAQAGIPCIDLRGVYAPYMSDPKMYRKLWVNQFDSHTGVLANRLAAEQILEKFGNEWLSGMKKRPALLFR